MDRGALNGLGEDAGGQALDPEARMKEHGLVAREDQGMVGGKFQLGTDLHGGLAPKGFLDEPFPVAKRLFLPLGKGWFEQEFPVMLRDPVGYFGHETPQS